MNIRRRRWLLGGSPHGARPKVLVQYDAAAGRVSTDEAAAGTPWLIKFPVQHEHKEVCAVERFDRHSGQQGVMRVPVHTLGGALNTDFRLPSIGYQSLLRATRALTHSEREVEKAFERCVFNVVFNNRDDHAKNFSFRMDARFAWNLAPCYDLTYNEGPGGEHQMDIEGEGRAPSRANLLKLAATNSLKPDWAAGVIDRTAVAAGEFKTLAKNYPIRPATRQTIFEAVEKNRLRMA